MRPIIVAGNWKLNHGPRAAEAFLDAYLEARRPQAEGGGGEGRKDLGAPETPTACRVVLFPPAVSLERAVRRVEGVLPSEPDAVPGADAHRSRAAHPPLVFGIQQIHDEPKGAFTGENSAPMAAEAGARFALVGHSERRSLFHETDDQVARRTQAAFRAGLHPMVCVGETLAERREGRLESVLRRQIEAVLSPPEIRESMAAALDADPAGFSVAYEPVWAIGTGETATPEDAAQAHGILRDALTATLGADLGSAVCILYGGSVNPSNAASLLAAPEVEGLLVGGASLAPDTFLALVDAGDARAAER